MRSINAQVLLKILEIKQRDVAWSSLPKAKLSVCRIIDFSAPVRIQINAENRRIERNSTSLTPCFCDDDVSTRRINLANMRVHSCARARLN